MEDRGECLSYRPGTDHIAPLALQSEAQERPAGGVVPSSGGQPRGCPKEMSRHRVHRSTLDSPGGSDGPELICRNKPTTGSPGPLWILPNLNFLWDESPAMSAFTADSTDHWSPAETEWSTSPPFEYRWERPSSPRVNHPAEDADCERSPSHYALPLSYRSKADDETPAKMGSLLDFFLRRSIKMKVGPGSTPPVTQSCTSEQGRSAVAREVSPSSVFWPRRSGHTSSGCSPASITLQSRESMSSAPSTPCSASDEDEMKVDVEPSSQRFTSASTIAAVEEGCAGVTAASAKAGETKASERSLTHPPLVVPATPSVREQDIVLPCPPSNLEKISYLPTGRLYLVTSGFISFMTLTTGLWLFTIASPYFFWFGAPTLFLMVYLVFHYFFVAIWGRDFEPKAHTEVVGEAMRQNFCPTVDIFLPVCNESLIILRNTWTYVKAMDYPRFNVHVLDDGAKDEVRELAASFNFNYVSRDDRPELKKAGNLRWAFARTSGEAIAIFDADFCPRSDFLRETTPYLLKPEIGIVQTPQFFRWRAEQTWVEQGAGASQEFFYRMVQMNQDRFGGAVCVGSCALYRRKAIEPFGGVAPIEHSEDMYTGFKMTEIGYKIKYVPLCLAMGICPDEPRSFFRQQYRWCMGSATLVFEKGFWNAKISNVHKICFLNGLLYYVSTAVLLFLAPLPIMLLIYVKADGVLWYYSGFAVPSILMATAVIPLWATQRHGMSCYRVRIIQCYAHLWALKDRLRGTVTAWVPSGGGAASSSSKGYDASMRLMIAWTVVSSFLIAGGSVWRMMEFPWYHYLPGLGIAFGSFFLNLSTLWY